MQNAEISVIISIIFVFSYGAQVKKYPSLIFFCEKMNIDKGSRKLCTLTENHLKFHIKNLQRKVYLFAKVSNVFNMLTTEIL